MAGTPRAGRRVPFGLALGAIVALALALRAGYLIQVVSLPFFDHPVGDSAAYLARAAEIGDGRWLPERPFFYGSIYYPYLIALIDSVTRHAVLVVCVLQILAGATLVGLVGLLARRWFGDAVALATAALAALYGPFAFLEADLIGVVWGLLGVVLALLGCERWERLSSEGTVRARMLLAGIGFALGLVALERPNLLVLVPVVAGWCFWVARARPRTVWTAAVPIFMVLVGAALPVLAVGALNLAGTGRWIPMTTSTGINLAVGYHARATGTFEEPWTTSQLTSRNTDIEQASVLVASRESGRALTPEEASTYWAHRAIEFVRAEPGAAAAVTARRALLLLNGVEIPNHLNFAFMQQKAGALRLMPVGFSVLLALAAAGSVAAWPDGRSWRGAALFVWVAVAAGASLLPFFVADRYRAPIVPSLLPLAGLGAIALGQLLTRSDRRREPRVAFVVAAALAGLVVAGLPLSRPQPARDHWLFAQAYEARGDHRQAARAYEAALSSEGDQAEILNNLGVTYRKLGAVAPAESAFRRAIAASPTLAYPRKNLGLLMVSTHRWQEALPQFEAAAERDPGDSETWAMIAGLLAERGEHVRAAAAFRQAWRLAPGDRRLERLAKDYPSLTGTAPTSP